MMKYRIFGSIHEEATIGSRSDDRGNDTGGSVNTVSGQKHNRCDVVPGNVKMGVEALERRNQNWIVCAKVVSDLIIQVADSSFHLHKLPMVSRSGYLNRLVFQRRSDDGEKDTIPKIQIHDFPGGAVIFETVVKFCYGWKVDLTAANIAPVFCAAHFLEMSEDFQQGNLISKAEAFLSFVLLSSWKDIFCIFKSCENITSWAKELNIVKRCSEAVAWKACLDSKTLSVSYNNALHLNVRVNNADNSTHEGIVENWWFEDVAVLRIDHFVEVIESLKRKGVRSETVGLCIAHWAAKWLSKIPFGLENLPKHVTHQLLGAAAENLIRVLPEQENSVSCNFLLHLLKLGAMTRIDFQLLNRLEGRIVLMLEQCRVSDLLVKNYATHDSVYDVGLVTWVVTAYASSALKTPAASIFAVGRLVDEYLMWVSRDEKLSANCFQSLAEALPKGTRYCDDNLYRSIDMYLKAHPSLTEEERMSICRAMDYHKLSQEACRHAMKNDRLPLNVSTRLILLEQMNMTRSMTDTGSSYRRTRTQAIIKASKGLQKVSMASKKEIKVMRREVENMKVQLGELEMCKIELQRQVKRCMISETVGSMKNIVIW